MKKKINGVQRKKEGYLNLWSDVKQLDKMLSIF